MIKKILLFKIILLIIIGCNSKPEKLKSDSSSLNHSEKDNYRQGNKVVITGVSDDKQALDYLDIIDGTYYFKKNKGDTIKKFNDTVVLVLNNIKQKQFSEFTAVSKTHYYKTNIYLRPRDSLFFEIKNGKLKFSGSNAKANNFQIELDQNTTSYQYNSYDSNLFDYKEKVESIYKEKIDFLNNYVRKHKITSVDILNFFKDDLRQEYLLELMNPRSDYIEMKEINQIMYGREIDGINFLISNEYGHKENLFSSKEYFNEVTFKDINRPDLVYNKYFRENLNLYIRNYFETSDNIDYSKGKFLAEKEFIENKLDKDLVNFAISQMIIDYYIKGFGYGVDNSDFMIKMIDQHKDKIDESTKEFLNDIKTDLLTYNFSLSNAALEAKMVNHIGDTTNLKEIFKRSTKRIKIVDFWASWCPPCVINIKDGKKFKDRLTVENNVEWIYLSIDEDKKRWKEKTESLKESLNFKNSYLLINGKRSPLAKFLKINTIPRYIIFDKKDKVVLNNAPTPNNLGHFEKIIDSIK